MQLIQDNLLISRSLITQTNTLFPIKVTFTVFWDLGKGRIILEVTNLFIALEEGEKKWRRNGRMSSTLEICTLPKGLDPKNLR